MLTSQVALFALVSFSDYKAKYAVMDKLERTSRIATHCRTRGGHYGQTRRFICEFLTLANHRIYISGVQEFKNTT